MDGLKDDVVSNSELLGLDDFDDLALRHGDNINLEVNIASSVGTPGTSIDYSTNSVDASLSKSKKVEDEMEEHEHLIQKYENILCVGKAVEDIEQLYLLYCEYGRAKGFCVRRGEQQYVGKSYVVRWKEYLCSSVGKARSKVQGESYCSLLEIYNLNRLLSQKQDISY